MQMRGRENQFKQQAADMLDRFISDLSSDATVDQPPKLTGNQFVLILAPIKKDADKN